MEKDWLKKRQFDVDYLLQYVVDTVELLGQYRAQEHEYEMFARKQKSAVVLPPRVRERIACLTPQHSYIKCTIPTG